MKPLLCDTSLFDGCGNIHVKKQQFNKMVWSNTLLQNMSIILLYLMIVMYGDGVKRTHSCGFANYATVQEMREMWNVLQYIFSYIPRSERMWNASWQCHQIQSSDKSNKIWIKGYGFLYDVCPFSFCSFCIERQYLFLMGLFDETSEWC